MRGRVVASPLISKDRGILDTMKFSILTPSYGYGHFIGDTVLSVLGQSLTDVEHVVMDGASEDETVVVLKRLEVDRRLKWRSEPDKGQSDALNKALAHASGEWVGLLNADEFYLPGTLDTVASVSALNPEVDVIYGDFAEVAAGGELDRLVAEHAFSPATLRKWAYIPTCTTFVRRAILPEAPWDTRCPSMMDWDFYLGLAGHGARFHHVRETLAAFRTHPDQVTKGADAQLPAEWEMVRARHGIPVRGAALRRVEYVGRSVHVARKLWEGGYIRELRARRRRGQQLRWFDD